MDDTHHSNTKWGCSIFISMYLVHLEVLKPPIQMNFLLLYLPQGHDTAPSQTVLSQSQVNPAQEHIISCC